MLTLGEMLMLEAYKRECARGIVHTREWQIKMQELQRRFDNPQEKTP
jgi:hypothetical protein